MGDEKVSVTLLNNMGDDLTVVNAARVSFAKTSTYILPEEPAGVDEHGEYWEEELREGDKKLISYLAKHGHWTPFSQPQIQLHYKMPIFVARQWFKHTVGFTRNEVSRRYIAESPEFWEPANGWRGVADDKKQGSSDEKVLENPSLIYASAAPLGVSTEALPYATYRDLLASCKQWYLDNEHICPEQRRALLPQAMMTEFHETGSLAAYARLVNLRNKPDAQKETQEYAELVDKLISPLYPESWKALTGG